METHENTYSVAQVQAKMLEILKCFINICEENHLPYWLANGTCIGALRHKGFIPWDEDLDVYMMRPDYEKLWDLYRDKTVDGQYIFTRTTDKKNYHHRVIQLVDTQTTFINRRSVGENIEHGVYIDILPLDAYPRTRRGQLYQRINAIIFSVYNVQCTPEYNGGKLTGIITVLTKIMLGIVPNKQTRYRIWKRAEKRMQNIDWDEANCVASISTTFREQTIHYPKAWFGVRKAEFEDILANIPKRAEDYCTRLYGDFMKLPPPEKRHVQHNTVKIDLENSYTIYKGKYYCVEDAKMQGK